MTNQEDKGKEMAERAAREREAASAKARLGKAAAERKVDDLKGKVEAGAAESRERIDAAVASAKARAGEAAAARTAEYTVKAGDSLSTIARDRLGAVGRWNEIYELNKAAIGDNPDVIKVGTVLKLPQ
jgi:nucleoid-associated protein YgaU